MTNTLNAKEFQERLQHLDALLREADVALVTKMDLAEAVEFDAAAAQQNI